MENSSSEIEGANQPHPFVVANNIVELINLKHEKLLEMVKEINSIAEYFLDDNGYRLSFRIVNDTDITFLWKLTVRIACLKSKEAGGVNDDDKSTTTCRLLRLNQFLNIFNHIKLQSESLKEASTAAMSSMQINEFIKKKNEDADNDNASSTKKKNSDNEKVENGPTSSKAGSKETSSIMNESKIFDAIKLMSPHESANVIDEDTCCICMDSKPNILLACTHAYCEQCIQEWKVTHKTCPICRCKSSDMDGFLMTDRPDYYALQDEISKSLFQITEHHSSKESRPSTSTSDSFHRNPFERKSSSEYSETDD